MLSALLAAAERGLKYGRKTGEIMQDAEKETELISLNRPKLFEKKLKKS